MQRSGGPDAAVVSLHQTDRAARITGRAPDCGAVRGGEIRNRAAHAGAGAKVGQAMDATCAECGRPFTAPFDIQRFFFGELRTDDDVLYHEVHYLAYHYHWSEREIMQLTRDKRHKYIAVLAGAIEGLNGGA